MKELLSKIVAGVIAGVIMFYLTQKYLIKSVQMDAQPSSQQTATVILKTPVEVAKPITASAEKLIASLPLEPKVEISEPEAAPPPAQPKPVVPLPQEADPAAVEKDLEIMIKEAQTKPAALSKDTKTNASVKKVQNRATDAFDELENP